MKDGSLRLENITFSYPEYSEFIKSRILKSLSLEIKTGEIVIIYGGAESGKSTLAMLLSGLVPLHTGGTVSGSAMLGDTDLRKTEACNLVEKCGIIFQDPEKQTVMTDCFDEAAFALESLGIPEAEICRRVESVFAGMGISHLRGATTAETSGGEKKRLALAGLIAVNPDLWILDETLEELDNPSRTELMDTLRDSKKTVIIFSSKHYGVFEKADGFYLLDSGGLSKRFDFPLSDKSGKMLTGIGIMPSLGTVKGGNIRLRPEKLIEASGLRYEYQAGSFSLDIDSFSLHRGETVSIVGRNGCGKSTFARILCGLLSPREGSVTVRRAGGGDLAGKDILNSFCAYMFQNPDYQIFLSTVSDELSWGLREAGVSADIIEERVKKAVEEFRLPDSSAPPSLMSFSARKRLQAAVYYLLERPVFILDEADTGMSYSDFTDLADRLRRVSEGIIIITHNLDLASAVSDRVLGMSRGKLFDIDDTDPSRLNDWLSDSEKTDGAQKESRNDY